VAWLTRAATVRLHPRQRHPRHPEPPDGAWRQALRRPPPSPRLSVSFGTFWLALWERTHKYPLTTRQKDTATGYLGLWAWLHGVYLGGAESSGIDPRQIREICYPHKVSPSP
jgi:hypothetical protein